MQTITFFVFLPLMLVLMVVAFNENAHKRLLENRWIQALEKRLVISERMYWLLFALIMTAGVFSRCWRFLELPLGYNQDGLMAAVEAYCLLEGGVDQLGTSWPTYFEAWGFAQMSTLYSWLMIPFVSLLGTTKLALRLPMLIMGLIMLPVVWDFARRMLGKGFALLALFVVAISPWHIVHCRWAVESNLLPHLLMLACYLLYLGRSNRWALYGSMILFGFAPYAYGLACFSVPVILLSMAVYYVARRKVAIADVLVCVVIFLGISGPFYYTMAINAFGLETVHLGPVTLPYFELSQRTMDMPFSQINPFAVMLSNVVDYVYSVLLGGFEQAMSAIDWAHTLYRFMPPLVVYAVYRMWRDRREMVVCEEDSARRDGMMLVLVWLAASLLSSLMIGFGVIRNNVSFFPLILVCAYGLYLLSCRLRTAAALAIAMLAVSFVGLNATYFADREYQQEVTHGVFHYGLVEALEDTWTWDYDEVYIGVGSSITSHKIAEAAIMFAHDIDYAGRSEQVELLNAGGEPTGWYFTERYHLVNMQEFTPDPMACSLYIFGQGDKHLFAEEDYLITDYGNYAVAYPRYWAE